MRSAYKSKTVVDWLDSIKRDAMWAKGIGMDVGYRGYQVPQSFFFFLTQLIALLHFCKNLNLG